MAQKTIAPKTNTTEFVPTEEQILKELRQKEVRKQYMTSDKAKAQRKAYMVKRYAETKAIRDAIKAMSPEKRAELEAQAKALAAQKK